MSVLSHGSRRIASALFAEARYVYRQLARPSVIRQHGIDIRLSSSDAPRIRESLYRGVYEALEAGIVSSTIDASDNFVELGGGLGLVGAIAATRIRDEAKVRIFEPNPLMAARIRDLLADNHLAGRVE